MESFPRFQHHECEQCCKTCNFFFNFFDNYCHYSGFSAQQKSSLGCDKKLLENVFWPWVSFQLLLSQILAVFTQLEILFQVF